MLLKISGDFFVSFEHIARFVVLTQSIQVRTVDGEQFLVEGESAEKLKFFLDEVYPGMGGVIDLDSIWERREQILETKKVIKAQIEAREKQLIAQRDQAAASGEGQHPGFMPLLENKHLREGAPAILRDAQGRPIKNVLVMPPKKKDGT